MKRIFFLLSVLSTATIIHVENNFGTTYVLYISVLTMVGVALITGIWVITNKLSYRYFFVGAPFVRTGKEELAAILGYVGGLSPKPRIADLGAGDGNIVIELAQFGYTVVGFEINPVLVMLAKLKVHAKRLGKYAQVELKNFWDQRFDDYDVIILFGIPYIMEDLAKKLKNECKHGTIVISNKFHIPEL